MNHNYNKIFSFKQKYKNLSNSILNEARLSQSQINKFRRMTDAQFAQWASGHGGMSNPFIQQIEAARKQAPPIVRNPPNQPPVQSPVQPPQTPKSKFTPRNIGANLAGFGAGWYTGGLAADATSKALEAAGVENEVVHNLAGAATGVGIGGATDIAVTGMLAGKGAAASLGAAGSAILPLAAAGAAGAAIGEYGIKPIATAEFKNPVTGKKTSVANELGNVMLKTPLGMAYSAWETGDPFVGWKTDPTEKPKGVAGGDPTINAKLAAEEAEEEKDKAAKQEAFEKMRSERRAKMRAELQARNAQASAPKPQNAVVEQILKTRYENELNEYFGAAIRGAYRGGRMGVGSGWKAAKAAKEADVPTTVVKTADETTPQVVQDILNPPATNPLAVVDDAAKSKPLAVADDAAKSKPLAVADDAAKSKPLAVADDAAKSKPITKPKDDGITQPITKPKDDGITQPITKPKDDGITQPITKPKDDGLGKPKEETKAKPKAESEMKTGKTVSRILRHVFPFGPGAAESSKTAEDYYDPRALRSASADLGLTRQRLGTMSDVFRII